MQVNLQLIDDWSDKCRMELGKNWLRNLGTGFFNIFLNCSEPFNPIKKRVKGSDFLILQTEQNFLISF